MINLRCGGTRQSTETTRRQVLGAVAGVGATLLTEQVSAQSTSGDRTQWTFTEAAGAGGTLTTVVEGVVYISMSGTDDTDEENATVFAVDAETGAQQWAVTEPVGRLRSPVVADGTVHVGADGTSPSGTGPAAVHALDAATGAPEWTFTDMPGGVSHLTVVDNRVYVNDREEILYALDATTGTVEWTFDEFQASPASPVTVADGTVYVGTLSFVRDGPNERSIYAVDAETGQERWTDSGIFTTAADGRVYVHPGPDNTLLQAVDADTGQEEWRFDEPSARGITLPTVADGTVYVINPPAAASEGNGPPLYALDADTGTTEWEYGERVSPFVQPTVAGETLFIGEVTDQERLRIAGLDTGTGDRMWEWSPPLPDTNQVQSISPLVVDGVLYAGTTDGPVYAVETEVSGSSRDSVAQLGTLGHHDGWLYADGAADREGNGDTDDASDGFGPGLGVGSALAALGGAGYLLGSRIADSDDAESQY
jgi:outer membrane protein assembly factor BamB